MTPEQIAALDLAVVRRGYDVAQVDRVLDVLAADLEGLREELARARLALARADASPGTADPQDDAETSATLVAAHDEAAAVVRAAHEEATAIVRRAREEAAAQPSGERPNDVAGLQERRSQLEAHVAALHEFAATYRERLRVHFEEQLGRLDALEPSETLRAATVDDLLPPSAEAPAAPG